MLVFQLSAKVEQTSKQHLIRFQMLTNRKKCKKLPGRPFDFLSFDLIIIIFNPCVQVYVVQWFNIHYWILMSQVPILAKTFCPLLSEILTKSFQHKKYCNHQEKIFLHLLNTKSVLTKLEQIAKNYKIFNRSSTAKYCQLVGKGTFYSLTSF